MHKGRAHGRRAAVVVLTAVLALTPLVAHARSTSPEARSAGAGRAVVAPCSGSLGGITVSWTSTDNAVTEVVVSSVPAACAGGRLYLTLSGAGNAAVVSAGPVAVTGTSRAFTSLSGSPAPGSVTGAYVALVGP